MLNSGTFGLYQPKKQNTGKRDLIAACEPIEDYFPAIISRETFEQCQRIAATNTTRKGRKGKVFTNLFTGLLKCADCGGPVHLLNPGIDKRAKVPKSVNYIVCKKGKFTRECILKRLRYDDFEITLLKAIQEINLADILDENNPLDALTKKLRTIETKIDKNKKLLENFQKSFIENDGALPSFMIDGAKQAELEIKNLLLEKSQTEVEVSQLNIYNSNIDNAVEELKANGTYETRSKINLLLHEIIKSIVIDFELNDYAIMFKNGAKRFINDGIIQNVFRTTDHKQRQSELEEIFNWNRGQ